MRTMQEIQNEFNVICAQLGNLEANRVQIMAQVDAQRKPLLDKIVELQKEAEQVKAVEAELAKKQAELAPKTELEPQVQDNG